MPVQVTFDATSMEPGDYTAEIVVQSNDPVTPTLTIPVTMTVEGEVALSLVPALQEGSGLPGETVVYTLTVTNLGNYTDTFSLEASGVWVPTLSAATTGPLGVGESFVFTLDVAVPGTATPGSGDTTTIIAQSMADPAVSESAEAITTAVSVSRRPVFLPLVLKNSD
jgi:uncharacterized membrane protein